MDNITLALIKAIAGNSGGGTATPGKDGVGISKIEKTDTQGLVDTYTISYTNGTTTTFTVTNGQNGQDGENGANGSPGKDGQNGITPTIGENGNWYLGDEDTGKPSRGEKGDKGDTGSAGPAGADGTPGTNGQDGSPGEDGFSPTIVENENNDESTYKLDITTKTGLFTTPNLKGGGEAGGGTGTSDYNALANKPKLNGVEIAGNKTSADYKIVSSEQGIENNGKFLGVGVDGNVTPVDKPTYTADEVGARPDTWTPSAEDVGALPNDTEIPSKTSDLENDSGFITNSDIPKKLPNPQKIIFTGAVTAEYDGSSQQTINIPTGGGSDPYTLPIMSDTQLGGGKAVAKTDEDVPVAVDSETGQLFVPTYPENTGGDVVNVDAELKEYMNVAKPAIASAIINKGGSVEPDDSLNDYATRISAIPNDVYPAETLPAQTNLSASGLQDSIGIKLNWSDVNASGYLILRKENAMPATSADGDIVYNSTYAADGYTDTGVQKGKVYYYRIFPRNSKNQYQSLEDGAVAMVDYKDRTGETLLGDLPLGSKIKFGQYSGADYFWEIVDTQDKASGFVTVAADQNLGNRQFDAPEPNSPISNRKTQGNNRWAYSAARQLLNSDADADAWWTAQYEYDAKPSYASQIPGFLKDFTTYEKGIIVTKTNKCILPNDDGGGTETVKDKFWFPSYYAMGLGVIQPLEDDHIYEKYTDNGSRSYQSSYWLRSINGAESPSSVRFVYSSGSANFSYAAYNYFAVRPFCQLPTSAYMTWSDSDEAYVFADDSQRNPLAT